MARRNSIQSKIEERLAVVGDDVFLTREFANLGGKRQVLRALANAVAQGQLVRLGYGIYARAARSRLSGQPVLDSKGGFLGAARQALNKLGVSWDLTEAQRDYNEGLSTQVPVNPRVKITGRFSRKISDGRRELGIDR